MTTSLPCAYILLIHYPLCFLQVMYYKVGIVHLLKFNINQNCILQGIKEITLLGQNVNSYCDKSEEVHYGGLPNNEAHEGESTKNTILSKGFKTIYKPQSGGRRFSHLLDQVSQIDPDMRIRFTSPHPKDFPDEVFFVVCIFDRHRYYCMKSGDS